ncbi:unnamed protein product [Hymenolepis diminuta]|uniref:DUF7083 domain-containing protein n=1 Tax=Hymenolepis diminuta TaxID=6216 RepID=A0A564YK00_HYMDI|nr:unnamed protein product [Hymenolepis diminuta]VUZ41636.1 unnamed protein product [Hymenolepis diminuta]VUZ47602.1 unnamed protein product [Hymenolepis diminuta]
MTQQYEEIFLKPMEQFTKNPNLNPEHSDKSIPNNFVLQINEVNHGPEVDLAFDNWFDKRKDVFRKDLADIPEEKRFGLLLRRLVTAEHKKLKSYVHPCLDEFIDSPFFL